LVDLFSKLTSRKSSFKNIDEHDQEKRRSKLLNLQKKKRLTQLNESRGFSVSSLEENDNEK